MKGLCSIPSKQSNIHCSALLQKPTKPYIIIDKDPKAHAFQSYTCGAYLSVSETAPLNVESEPELEDMSLSRIPNSGFMWERTLSV